MTMRHALLPYSFHRAPTTGQDQFLMIFMASRPSLYFLSCSYYVPLSLAHFDYPRFKLNRCPFTMTTSSKIYTSSDNLCVCKLKSVWLHFIFPARVTTVTLFIDQDFFSDSYVDLQRESVCGFPSPGYILRSRQKGYYFFMSDVINVLGRHLLLYYSKNDILNIEQSSHRFWEV